MKIPLYKAFFSCLAFLLYAGHSQASSPDDFIHEHLVTFSPPILEGNHHHPCQGVRVSSKVILTSDSCVHLVTEQINSGIPVEVLNSQRTSIGKVTLLFSSESNKGFLGLDTGNAYVKPDERYPTLQHTSMNRLKPAKAFLPAAV